MTDLDTYQAEPLEWLWRPWMPLGALVFANGDPEVGKSWLACDMAARITTGRLWPDASPCRQGDVFYASAEDPPAVIKQRIFDCGGNLKRVRIPQCGPYGDETGLLLQKYLPQLEKELTNNPEYRLLVIDTISAMLPHVDFSRIEQVQRGCQILKVLAKRHQLTVLCTHHLPKDWAKRSLIHATSGSIGFTAAPRAAVLVGRLPGTDRRVLMPQKASWTIKPQPLAFDIEDDKVVWRGTTDVSWSDLSARGRVSTVTTRVRDWLQSRLEDKGAVPVRHIQLEAETKGYAWRTVKRAAAELELAGAGPKTDRTWELRAN